MCSSPAERVEDRSDPLREVAIERVVDERDRVKNLSVVLNATSLNPRPRRCHAWMRMRYHYHFLYLCLKTSDGDGGGANPERWGTLCQKRKHEYFDLKRLRTFEA
jgi:hypothetical protein